MKGDLGIYAFMWYINIFAVRTRIGPLVLAPLTPHAVFYRVSISARSGIALQSLVFENPFLFTPD